MLIRRSCRLAVILAVGAMTLGPANGAVAATSGHQAGINNARVPAKGIAPACLLMPETAGCDKGPLTP
jgi:hypothetical protein